MSDEIYLTPKEACEFINKLGARIAVTTLSKYRCVGGGPVYQTFGRSPRYTPRRLTEWVQERLSPERRSSSQAA